MKRILIVAVILFTVLTSCYFSGDGSVGSLSIVVQTAGAKAIGDTDTYDTARVYMMSTNTDLENAFYDFGDGEIYTQAAIENGTVTVEGAPVGNWNVLVALGSLEGSESDIFYVQQYGESGAVQILSGVTNEVTVTSLKTNPFATATELFGQDVVGVAELGASLYAAEPGALHSYTGPDFSAYGDKPDPLPGQTINSISPGLNESQVPVLYINTNQGIFLPGAPYTEFSIDLGEVPVLDSGAYEYGAASPETVVYFQRDGGLGGALLDYLPYDWVDVDLSDVITGQPVLDFEVVDDPLDCVFFVTKLGSFALSTDLVDGGSPSADEVFELAVFFNDIGGFFYSIRSVGYDSAGGQMYLGTDDGAYVGVPSPPPADTFSSVSLVPGTAGMAIDMVEVSPSSGHVAFLSNLNLYMIKGTDVVKIPFYGGLPGTVRRMTWHSSDVLLIAGSTGLVSLDPADVGL